MTRHKHFKQHILLIQWHVSFLYDSLYILQQRTDLS